MQLITVATCSLNQWALDFEGNKSRILDSIRKAKEAGACLRVGPELEITGYGCLDHFLEGDLYLHSWEVLRDIVDAEESQGILVDVGMPVQHRSCYYNCRVIFRDRKILMIRPKMALANDGNFREMRYFTPWERRRQCEDFRLPTEEIRKVTGQSFVKFGDCVLEASDTVIAAESCEELFTPDSPHIHMGLDGVEIFTNSSGSHHQLRKLDTRMNLILEATMKSGGVYLYANQQGCDGDRLYYDGCAMIVVNGEIKAQGSQFSLNDVEVVTATVDLDEVRSYRFPPSRRMQANKEPSYPRVYLEDELSKYGTAVDPNLKPSPSLEARYFCAEEEIALGPACWLWDYLRRSRQAGFFIPLSGGIDSCSTAVIVFSMCRLIYKAVEEGDQAVIADMRRTCGEADDSTWLPKSPQEITGRLFHTSFMGTSNSSKDTRSRAKGLSEAIGAYHVDMNMDSIVNSVTSLFSTLFSLKLKYKVHGGGHAENVALQNIQARLRMVVSYLFAQTLCTVRKRRGGGSLLVLGSANVDESLRGYLTKYDCSSADLNPIGAISKTDLKAFISWAKTNFDIPILEDFLTATPTAELEPITSTYVQSDEADMGISYPDLSIFGRLRKVNRLGPYGQFSYLRHYWSDKFTPRQVMEKVKHFNFYYGINRHKMTTITPAYHAEMYSPDDNRYDLRPFLYPQLTWAYKKIEREVEWLEAGGYGKQVNGDAGASKADGGGGVD